MVYHPFNDVEHCVILRIVVGHFWLFFGCALFAARMHYVMRNNRTIESIKATTEES